MGKAESRNGGRWRRDWTGENGTTLNELLVATAVTLIVATAVMAFVVITNRQYQSQEERVTAIDEARNALLLMVGELRDADAVTLVNQRTVDARVRDEGGGFAAVRYSCAVVAGGESSCTRTEGTESEVIAEGVVNADNFLALSGGGDGLDGTTSLGGSIEMRFEVSLDQAENPVVLSSAVKPRNCAAAAAGVVNPPC